MSLASSSLLLLQNVRAATLPRILERLVLCCQHRFRTDVQQFLRAFPARLPSRCARRTLSGARPQQRDAGVHGDTVHRAGGLRSRRLREHTMGWTSPPSERPPVPRSCAKAFPGYTVISMSSGKEAYPHRHGRPRLPPMASRRGHLLRLPAGQRQPPLPGRTPAAASCRAPGTPTGILELDWDSNLVWSYSDPLVHHDFVAAPGRTHPDGALRPHAAGRSRAACAEDTGVSRSPCTASWCARWTPQGQPCGSGACGSAARIRTRTLFVRWKGVTSGCTRTP